MLNRNQIRSGLRPPPGSFQFSTMKSSGKSELFEKPLTCPLGTVLCSQTR
ncbi:hypothetical protein HOLDEFILI_04001 [Holdemania filiformis DSM 12042]|uniref:Uncharacterized protein n=1 Tax=Holdemania filiformis DSM 12042 TaxID=545696 RepID=B9YDS7_9FIRM|nr:hypothetical protein HOLDEFILI_04001 [Holdemania filiformis DSM 12042]